MESLPDDIRRRIGDELDLESARCLAMTSRSLREIGEKRVWEVVDFSDCIESADNKGMYTSSIGSRPSYSALTQSQ